MPDAPHFPPFSGPWWHQMMLPELSWPEKLIRPLLVYLAMMVIFRLVAKRELAQATLFDFLIVLLISNVVQNAIIGNDNSVLGALGGAVTLIILSSLLNRMTAKSKTARVILEGKPVMLVSDGIIDDREMNRQSVSRNDLLSSIRKAGIVYLCDVAYAILELDGSISIIKREDRKDPPDCLPVEVVGDVSAEAKEEENNPQQG